MGNANVWSGSDSGTGGRGYGCPAHCGGSRDWRYSGTNRIHTVYSVRRLVPAETTNKTGASPTGDPYYQILLLDFPRIRPRVAITTT